MIEPISVCEDDAGRPSHQVPRFQMIAAISSANTMAKPALRADLQDQLDRQQRDDAEGDRAARTSSTPRKLKKPDQTTANSAGSEWV